MLFIVDLDDSNNRKCVLLKLLSLLPIASPLLINEFFSGQSQDFSDHNYYK